MTKIIPYKTLSFKRRQKRPLQCAALLLACIFLAAFCAIFTIQRTRRNIWVKQAVFNAGGTLLTTSPRDRFEAFRATCDFSDLFPLRETIDLIRFGANCTDHDLQVLNSAPDLVSLTVDRANVTNAGFSNVIRMPLLRNISVNNCNAIVGDGGLCFLKHAKELEELSLCYTNIGDELLEFVDNLDQISVLSISGTRCTTPFINRCLTRMPRISWLCIDDCSRVVPSDIAWDGRKWKVITIDSSQIGDAKWLDNIRALKICVRVINTSNERKSLDTMVQHVKSHSQECELLTIVYQSDDGQYTSETHKLSVE